MKKIGAVSKRKRKGKREQTHKVAAASHHAFVNRGACHREKEDNPPRVCEREGAPYAPIRERERSAENKKERRKKESPGCAPQSECASQSDVKERARPTARGEGRGRRRVARSLWADGVSNSGSGGLGDACKWLSVRAGNMIYVAPGVGKVVSGVPASVLVSQGKLDDECDSGNDEGHGSGYRGRGKCRHATLLAGAGRA